MKHTIIALAAAATLAAALPSSAQARCHGCGVAAGVVGGLAAGAIIGSAIANSGPAYVEPAPVYAPPPPPTSDRQRFSKATSATSSIAASGLKATAGGRAASRSATSAPLLPAHVLEHCGGRPTVDFQTVLLLIRAERRARQHARFSVDLVLVKA